MKLLLKHVYSNGYGLLRRNISRRELHAQINSSQLSYIKILKMSGGTITGCFLAYDFLNDMVYIKATGRFLRSMKTACLICKDYLILMKKGDSNDYESLLKECHLKSASRLLDTCLLNGGLYIKIGQGVAAINHMLPEEYTASLTTLQDKCLASGKESIQKVFLEEFKKLPEEIFHDFNYEPVAAASLAQVFQGKLKDGRKVAIKVQYSDLQTRFRSDVGTIIFLQNIIELFFKNYNFGWILKDIKNNLLQEMDFIREAKNSEKCAKDLQNLKFVYIPKVYWDYTSKRILTLEWIDGTKITDLNWIRDNHINLKEVDIKLFHLFAEQIFRSGFVHADPHPGNIFIRKGMSGELQLVLLDHGLYETIPANIRQPLCEFWEATVLRDETKMEDCSKRLGVQSYKNFAEVLFQVPFNVNNGEVKAKLSKEDIEYMKEVGRRNFEMIMQTLQEMPKNMLFVIRNLNTVRAISREHGDPVNRPLVIARYAQSCLRSNCKYINILGYLKWMYRRIQFEFYFMCKSIKLSIISLYIDLLYKIGRSPESSQTIFIRNV